MATNAIKHPAGKLRTPLIALRIVQVIVSAVSRALSAWLTITFGAAYRQLQADRQFQASQPEAQALLAVLRMLTIICGVSLAVALTSLVCSTTLLVYTISPKMRSSSCSPCERYSCDLGWDCFWATLCGISVIGSVIMAAQNPAGTAIGGVLISLGMFVLYLATAIMSGKVRRNVLAQKAQGMGASQDVQATAGGAASTHDNVVGGVVVAEPMCKPPPVFKA